MARSGRELGREGWQCEWEYETEGPEVPGTAI